MVKKGWLYNKEEAQIRRYYNTFKDNPVAQFLYQFFEDNNLNNLLDDLIADPNGENTDWEHLLDDLLHNFDYANYLFSLPMGAGKTFLMACFIYIDLYFACQFKNSNLFAHNFIVFAPHASKTAILPSLKTIKDFNPEWILPDDDAKKLKQIITIETLDRLSSERRDKLHGNNPNLEKVNRLKQTQEFGLVFITNAEKVVLEKFSGHDQQLLNSLQQTQQNFFDKRSMNEIEKTNELRESLSLIPNMTVILDEVHHSYGSTGNGEKKLRQAVKILNQHHNINSVVGLTGTPYVKNQVEVNGKRIRLNQIQDIVYNYSLHTGIRKFLKKPDIRKVNVNESAFLKQALDDFFDSYDKQYKNGTQSKIAFYFPTVKILNEDAMPVIQAWYREKRPGKEDEIFRYYSKVSNNNRQFSLPKDSLAIFNNLDKPYSKKRVILLVAVGKEGWDCKSLTSVVLPRQKTTKNFVLQTTCRCLREVDDASKENALIYLSAENYETLDKELESNYKLSISTITEDKEKEPTILLQVRKSKLGTLKFNQLETRYEIARSKQPDIKLELANYQISVIKNKFQFDNKVTIGEISRSGLTGELQTEQEVVGHKDISFTFNSFLYQLAEHTYGRVSENELKIKFFDELCGTYQQIEENMEWIDLNPHIDIDYVINDIAQTFMYSVEYEEDVITEETEIELLEWQGDDNELSILSSDGKVNKFMPKIGKFDFLGNQGYAKYPGRIEDDYFDFAGEHGGENVDPRDISFNYVPYKMDSEFEQNALEEMLKLAELKNFEVYFNGYKNKNLQSFWIQTPWGKYTPDFLILKRKNLEKYNKYQSIAIEKILIIETKGKPFYNQEFKAKESFVKGKFLLENKHIYYHCFVDKNKNDFTIHSDELKEILNNF